MQDDAQHHHAAAQGVQTEIPAIVHSRTGYSITRSARRRMVCGIFTPSARAVLRLMTSSTIVGRLDTQHFGIHRSNQSFARSRACRVAVFSSGDWSRRKSNARRAIGYICSSTGTPRSHSA